MKKVSKKDKLFFFEKHFKTLDGLWMIETEKETDWETALKIDLNVWIRLLKIIIRRIKRHLGMTENNIENLIKILSYRWIIEGWEFEIAEDGILKIISCPYNEAMKRNPERHDRIKSICKDMCIPFYKTVVKDFNADIKVKREHFSGLNNEYCDFQFYDNDKKFLPSKELINFNMDINDKILYFEPNFFTMDGLWIIEVENETDWATALKVDIIVWQKLYKIIFRRVKRYLAIEGNSLQDLIEILSFCWSCEGYKYEIVKNEMKEAILHITECPYHKIMQRNPERHDKIEAICKEMCIPFYEPALKAFNPQINLNRKKFLGIGDKYCDFHFKVL
jgi:hypothetical protein